MVLVRQRRLAPVQQIEADGFGRPCPDLDRPLLPSFAEHDGVPLVEMQLGQAQPTQLTGSDARIEQQEEDGLIAGADLGPRIERIGDGGDLGFGEDRLGLLRHLGGLEPAEHRRLSVTFVIQPAGERPERADIGVDGGVRQGTMLRGLSGM